MAKNMIPEVRGISEEDERQSREFLRETRSFGWRFSQAIARREIFLVLLIGIAVLDIAIPAVAPILLIVITFLFIARALKRQRRLPWRMPYGARGVDRGDPKPGRGGFFKPGGLFYVGNTWSGYPLWLKLKDVLTHMLVFGTTGSGKTEFLVSMAANVILMGSGLYYVDAKGAPKLAFQLYALARLVGRDDDYLLLNYQSETAATPEARRTPKRMSNTTNVFAYGTANMLSELLISLIPSAEGGNSIFQQNAQALVRALLFALCEMRDRGEIELSIEKLREYMDLNRYITLALRKDLSGDTVASLQAFLSAVGWLGQDPEKGEKLPRNLPEQFSYAKAYFAQSLNSLSDTYGYIYRVKYGEVDWRDVILNRRILCVILPTLGKAEAETKNLGRLTLSSVQNAISVGLGDRIEGTVDEVLEKLPTNSRVPFLGITDEHAAIPTPGYATVLTQGRGLGIAAIVASQDYAGMYKSDEGGTKQIEANTKVKMALKLEDTKETWELWKSLSGEAEVARIKGYESVGLTYRPSDQVSVERTHRVDMRDLQQQIEGEFHAFFNGDIVRGRSFFADPKLRALRLVRLLPTPTPDGTALSIRYGALKQWTVRLREKKPLEVKGKEAPVAVSVIAEEIRALRGAGGARRSMDRMIAALVRAARRLEEGGALDGAAQAEAEGRAEPAWADENLHGDMARVEQSLGASPEEAERYASEVEGEINDSLKYPRPPIPEPAEADYLSNALDSLLSEAQAGSEGGAKL